MKRRRPEGTSPGKTKEAKSLVVSAFDPKNITRLYTTPQLKNQKPIGNSHLLDDLRNQVVSSNMQIR
jgi:hypothetical protein